MFRKQTIVVNGTEVVVDVDEDLAIADLSGDMDTVASQMAYWGAVWAAAVREKMETDSHYRHWRAQQTELILEADKKLAEWKVKAKIESQEPFLKFKAALALAERNVTLTKAVFDSFDKKSNQLQSKGAMSRSEIDATGMHTPKKPKQRKSARKPRKLPAVPLKEDDERVSAMKDIFKKK